VWRQPLIDYRPQLATLVKEPPKGARYLHEVKYDGYRMGCRIEDGTASLSSRKGQDWTAEFPEIAQAALSLKVKSALLDGEVCILLGDGRTSFQALQNSLGGRRRGELVYFVFDLLELNGRDLSGAKLTHRRAALQKVLSAADAALAAAGARVSAAEGAPKLGAIRISTAFEGEGAEVLREACKLGFEGIVSKRLDSANQTGRSTSWVKTKCVQRQEFVVGGFTEPEGVHDRIAALLVGVFEEGTLRFAGKVGTGFSAASARELRKKLDALRVRECPFVERPEGWLGKNAFWVRPQFVAEVAFSEWTEGGHLRHPSFQGLRADKASREVVKEQPDREVAQHRKAPERRIAQPGRPVVRGVALSHSDRVVFVKEGLTKLDLARYHDAVAEWELPHLEGRPLTLLRCGGEISEGCAFMKHSKVWSPAALRRVRIKEKHQLGEYLVADTPEALLSLVQMDIIEIHTWNTRDRAVELPDRIVIDLDPGPLVAFRQVVEAALRVRAALKALGLASFVKTTGGSGLHVVAPIVPERDWSECLAFARDLSEAFVRQDPKLFTTRNPKAGRERHILLDYLRNNRTNTSVAAYSPRARPGAPVSLPVDWDELTPKLDPLAFTVRTVPERLRAMGRDPWKKLWGLRQRLSRDALLAVTNF
jgi:bifunctional non-homologous end joining protein LigD